MQFFNMQKWAKNYVNVKKYVIPFWVILFEEGAFFVFPKNPEGGRIEGDLVLDL